MAYLEAFLKSGDDPQLLPRVESPDWAEPAASLEKALAHADIVSQGVVSDVEYRPVDSGYLPWSIARVSITTRVVDRAQTIAPEVDELSMVEVGGPALTEGEQGVLMHVESDKMVFASEEVVLLLQEGADGMYRVVPGAGVYTVDAGAIVAQHGNVFAAEIQGLPVEAFLAAITTAVDAGR